MRFGIFYEHQNPASLGGGALRALPAEGRARADRAGRPRRLRLRLGGGAPLPRGVLALLGPGGVPGGRRQRTKQHPPGPRDRPDPAGGQPSRRGWPSAWPRSTCVCDGRLDFGTGESSSARRARRLPGRPRAQARDVGGRHGRDHPHVRGGAVRRLGLASTSSMPPRNVVPEAAAEAPPAALGGLQPARDHPLRRPQRASARCRSRSSSRRTPASGSTEYYEPDRVRGVRAGRASPSTPNVTVVLPMMLPRGRADRHRARHRRRPLLRLLARPLLRHGPAPARRAPASGTSSTRNRDERGFAREIVTPTTAPLAVKIMQQGLGSLRGAIGTPGAGRRPRAPLPGGGGRPDRLRAAGGAQQARAHLRGARAVRRAR